jgi:hypothetical protein
MRMTTNEEAQKMIVTTTAEKATRSNLPFTPTSLVNMLMLDSHPFAWEWNRPPIRA